LTRGKKAYDSGKNPISLDEWKKYIKTDPELFLEEDYEINLGGVNGINKIHEPGRVLWKAHKHGGYAVPFWYSDGYVHIKNPCGFMVNKLWDIAQKLNARVLPEEGDEVKEKEIPLCEEEEAKMGEETKELEAKTTAFEKEFKELEHKHGEKIKKLKERFKTNKNIKEQNEEVKKLYDKLDKEFFEIKKKYGFLSEE
jgi:glutamyl/glutaminyl-tRNA synthetase